MSSEANKDEALKCFELSKRFFAQAEHELALKYAQKSIRLFSTDEGKLWLDVVEKAVSSTQSNSSSASTESVKNGPTSFHDEKFPSTSSDSRKKPNNAEKKSERVNEEQIREVKRMLSIDKNDYYTILGLERGADDVDIKKAYRKLALQFHPDKNLVTGADEAFKMVSRAFSCLSDPDKRAQYDRFGGSGIDGTGDAFNPFGGFSSGTTSTGGIRFRHNATGFDHVEISPEDLFRMFFGGAFDVGGGNRSGGLNFASTGFGPIFTSFGSSTTDGFFHRSNTEMRRKKYQRYQQQKGQQRHEDLSPLMSIISMFLQLIPIIVMALVVFFSSLLPKPHED